MGSSKNVIHFCYNGKRNNYPVYTIVPCVPVERVYRRVGWAVNAVDRVCRNMKWTAGEELVKSLFRIRFWMSILNIYKNISSVHNTTCIYIYMYKMCIFNTFSFGRSLFRSDNFNIVVIRTFSNVYYPMAELENLLFVILCFHSLYYL